MKVLDHQYSVQETGYWCGPGSTQIVLTCRGIDVPEQQLAYELGTHTGGTDWIGQITKVLAARTGQPYVTREMPNDPPTRAQKDLLWNDIRSTIDAGLGLVANIVAPANNHPPGYPNYTIYHYVAIVGYDDALGVYVADPASFSGIEHYWLSLEKMASLICPKGYSAAPSAVAPVVADPDADTWRLIREQFVGPVK